MSTRPVLPELCEAFAELRDELASRPLVVEIVPAPRPMHCGHGVRVAVSTPPVWYRRLCAAHPSSRGWRRGKPDTRIKRANVLALLDRLANGEPTTSRYAPALLRQAVRLRTARAA